MRVEFDGSALVGTECAPEIVAIAALCALGGSPHRLVTDETALRNWAMSQVPTLAEWIGLIAEMGREAEEGAGRPIRGTLTVLPTNADSSRWRRPARAALALLRRPFRVVLENSRADRAFHGQGDEPLAFGAAWFELDWGVRSYLDVKKGLTPARNDEGTVQSVPEGLRPYLSKGLGRDFATTFYEAHQGLRHEDTEITDMLQAFLERV